MISDTPKPPYYAVIFSSIRTDISSGYADMADRMVELAQTQDGFLGIETARSGLGITVSYWRDLGAIKKWKQHTDHLIAQEQGRKDWYSHYKVRIALVEREYGFEVDNRS